MKELLELFLSQSASDVLSDTGLLDTYRAAKLLGLTSRGPVKESTTVHFGASIFKRRSTSELSTLICQGMKGES